MIARFFFGMFGLMEYVFPVLLVPGFLFVLSNRRNPKMRRKMAGAAGLFLLLCAFLQLVIMHYDRHTRIMDLYYDSAYDKSGGGLAGGVIVQIFGNLFGQAGAYVCVLIGLIIFAILMTQEPLLGHLRVRSEKAYENAVENRAKRAEGRKKRKEMRAFARKFKIARQDSSDLTDDTDEYEEEDETDLGSVEEIEKQEKAVSSINPEPTEIPFEPFEIPETVSFPEEDRIGDSASESGSFDSVRRSGQALMNALSAGTKSRKNKAKKAEKRVPADSAPDTERTIPADIVPDIEKTVPADIVPDTEKNVPADSAPDTGNAAPAGPAPVRKMRGHDGERYEFPPLSLMKAPSASAGDAVATRDELRTTAEKLQQTLNDFGVGVQVTDVSCGPTVTRYELHPEHGVKVSRILNLQDDIKLNLAAADIRIEAPIPGKAAVGIEVPNKTNSTVMLRELLQSGAFRKSKAKIPFAVGKDIAGKTVVADISKMPHLLIAGATGSGKSVCINTLIVSILYRCLPEEVKFIMIDPKMVELSVYNGIPHLYIPVVTDPKKAAGALNWAVSEMIDRYNRFAGLGVRDLDGYNAKIAEMPDPEDGSEKPKRMPRIVIIVDELADLMMVAQHEVEDAIVRLSQLARAAGIHLVIATQRPSVNVITGLIKANMPSRIALAVTSGVDSRTILDMNGAEKLLGKGDMLFYPQGYQKPARVQGAFVSDEEIASITAFLNEKNEKSEYDAEAEKKITESAAVTGGPQDENEEQSKNDVYFERAGRLIIEKDKASIGMLQRAFKIGFNRAARIMDQLCDAGVVGEEEGTKPRHILMTMAEFQNFIETHDT